VARLKEHYWWAALDKDVANYIRQCQVCQRATAKNSQGTPQLRQLPETKAPNERLHVDLYGPLKTMDGTKKMVCVMTDAFTKMVSLKVINGKHAGEVAKAIMEGWIFIFGCPG
jgi:hypothetical protein